MEASAAGHATTLTPALRPLLEELGELKRVRSAGREGSIATRLFQAGWARLVAGETTEAAMRATVADALAAARLGDLDAAALGAAGMTAAEILAVRRRAVEEVSAEFPPELRALLQAGLEAAPAPQVALPRFVGQLAEQPRAGVTCPGKPRLLLEPPENHAEHCLIVAVYGVVLAPRYGADPATVFLASMAHHLHNALLPDSGFTGEVLLGDRLEPVFARATEIALEELPGPLRDAVVVARRILPDAESGDSKTFHAADTLDRVLQIAQHLRAGQTTMHYVLHDMALVHEGAVKDFQDVVLRETGLL
ncbi:HD domain-containing protein [Roseomonas elaeocarpi]|uniref:HD domain-containing protein n=1 Tax=Roseomonas elaeocarpi TaxID=907779 RepID=A0ABV6JUK5_9PROT